MRFLKYLFFSVLAIFVFLGCSKEESKVQYKQHSFTAKVQDVRLSANLLRQGKAKDEKVSVNIPSLMFNPPIYVQDVRKVRQSVSAEVAFIISYLKANAQGQKEKIYEVLVPSYRKEMQGLFDDETIFKRNTAIFEKNPELTVYGQIKQGNSVSVLAKYGPYDFVVGITLVQVDGKLYITDKPTNDLDLAIAEASF